jgi:hypothetical protein
MIKQLELFEQLIKDLNFVNQANLDNLALVQLHVLLPAPFVKLHIISMQFP